MYKIKDMKKTYAADQIHNAKSSSFLEKVSLPPMPAQPYRSPSEFSCWLREIRDLIQSRRAADKISLRSLKMACAHDSNTKKNQSG